jgi:hypothetical protein
MLVVSPLCLLIPITIYEQGLESCYAAPTLYIESVSDTDT